jgi:hypothetical protein
MKKKKYNWTVDSYCGNLFVVYTIYDAGFSNWVDCKIISKKFYESIEKATRRTKFELIDKIRKQRKYERKSKELLKKLEAVL